MSRRTSREPSGDLKRREGTRNLVRKERETAGVEFEQESQATSFELKHKPAKKAFSGAGELFLSFK